MQVACFHFVTFWMDYFHINIAPSIQILKLMKQLICHSIYLQFNNHFWTIIFNKTNTVPIRCYDALVTVWWMLSDLMGKIVAKFMRGPVDRATLHIYTAYKHGKWKPISCDQITSSVNNIFQVQNLCLVAVYMRWMRTNRSAAKHFYR